MKTLYLAGSLKSAERLKKEASRLKKLGYTITSHWFNNLTHTLETNEIQAMVDVYGVLESNVVVIDTLESSTSGGRSVELGLALQRRLVGQDVRIVRIGPPDNVFFNLVRETYPTWGDFYLNEACCKGWELDKE